MALKFLASVLALAASAATSATTVETWKCKDWPLTSDDILVTATVDSSRESGEIQVAGITQTAAFRVEGFNRRWDFGPLPDHSYRYSFVIEPNGLAKYFDSAGSGAARTSLNMKCSKSP